MGQESYNQQLGNKYQSRDNFTLPPISGIQKMNSPDEMVSNANSMNVWHTNPDNVAKIARALKTGDSGINDYMRTDDMKKTFMEKF